MMFSRFSWWLVLKFIKMTLEDLKTSHDLTLVDGSAWSTGTESFLGLIHVDCSVWIAGTESSLGLITVHCSAWIAGTESSLGLIPVDCSA